jgi:hypothetical protein
MDQFGLDRTESIDGLKGFSDLFSMNRLVPFNRIWGGQRVEGIPTSIKWGEGISLHY